MLGVLRGAPQSRSWRSLMVGGVSDLVYGEVAHNGHVDGSMALAQTRLIFVECTVQNPMKLVLDAPMTPNRVGSLFGGQVGGADVVADLLATEGLQLSAALDLDERLDAREPKRAGKAPIPLQPIDLTRDGDAALLDPSMAFVPVDERVPGLCGRGFEQ